MVPQWSGLRASTVLVEGAAEAVRERQRTVRAVASIAANVVMM